jgi:hypothetical protein
MLLADWQWRTDGGRLAVVDWRWWTGGRGVAVASYLRFRLQMCVSGAARAKRRLHGGVLGSSGMRFFTALGFGLRASIGITSGMSTYTISSSRWKARHGKAR